MSFTGPAARWLQSIEHSLHQVTWHEFGLLIRERFGKNQHETFLRQLLHIRQYSSVSDYIEQFAISLSLSMGCVMMYALLC
jgi:hypothetical protein